MLEEYNKSALAPSGKSMMKITFLSIYYNISSLGTSPFFQDISGSKSKVGKKGHICIHLCQNSEDKYTENFDVHFHDFFIYQDVSCVHKNLV